MNAAHETNRRFWDRTPDSWRRLREEDGLAEEPELAAVFAAIARVLRPAWRCSACARPGPGVRGSGWGTRTPNPTSTRS